MQNSCGSVDKRWIARPEPSGRPHAGGPRRALSCGPGGVTGSGSNRTGPRETIRPGGRVRQDRTAVEERTEPSGPQSGMKVDARRLWGVASKVRLDAERVRFRAGAVGWQVNMGMIGFDVGHGVGRSGPRMQSQLVNVLCKTIGAKSNNRTDFALAA